jgi:hypothetical protein
MYIILNVADVAVVDKHKIFELNHPVILDGENETQVAVYRYIMDFMQNTKIQTDELLEPIKKIAKLGLTFIVITSSIPTYQKLLTMKIKSLYQPPYQDPTMFLDSAIKLLNEPYISILGYFDTTAEYSAGILPFVYHNGELFCMLGCDGLRKKYSDFGGKFDKKIKFHTRDRYKNTVLGTKQTLNGTMSTDILIDHYITHPLPESILVEDKTSHKVSEKLEKNLEKQLVYDPKRSTDKHSILAREGEKKIKYSTEEHVGFGDTNTKYTAFRELIEETSFVNPKSGDAKEIGYMFDPNVIFNKLYIKGSYIYLGGNKEYSYDMFLIFMTVDQLPENFKTDFLKLYDLYKKDKNLYVNSRLLGPTSQNCIKIHDNREMNGIDAIPLSAIMERIDNIEYEKFKKRESHKTYKTYKMYKTQQMYPMLDGFRPCFADAVVRYKMDFKFIDKSFDKIKEILL